MPQTNYLDVTEIAGDDVTQEQVERLYHRYYWAGTFCQDKDVVEVACGTGQGLGYLANIARSLEAGDYSQDILDIAQSHYKDRIKLCQLDAQNLPYENSSKDVIILFEAIYYLPDAEQFIKECRRVLRQGGKVLIATANKDLYDFNPSPYTYQYYGVVELHDIFSKYGFEINCYGHSSIAEVSWKQRILRPIKKIVVQWGLMPKTMNSKKLLKKLVFGGLVPMPSEINSTWSNYQKPNLIEDKKPNVNYKVIYVEAKLLDK